VWDPGAGKETHSLEGAGPPLAFSPKGEWLVCLRGPWAQGRLSAYDLTKRAGRPFAGGQEGGVHEVSFSPDGARLASAGADRTVRVWDVATGEERLAFREHTDEVWAVAFSPDGKLVVSGGKDGRTRVWDAASGQERQVKQVGSGSTDRVGFSPDGSQFASSQTQKSVYAWRVADGNGTAFLTLTGHYPWFDHVALNPGRGLLASGNQEGHPRLWDANTGRELFRLTDPAVNLSGRWVKLVALSDDGARAAAVDKDGVVRLWKTATGELLASHQLPGPVWGSLAFSRDCARLAVSGDKEVVVWDVPGGREPRKLAGADRPTLAAFSPDGRALAVADDGPPRRDGKVEASVRLWDLESRSLLHTLRPGDTPVHSLAFSPDGTRLACGGEDAVVRVWDVPGGQEVIALRGHTKAVHGLAFSGDGRRLASVSADDMLRLWDTETWEQLLLLSAPASTQPGHRPALAFSHGDRRLTLLCDNATAFTWDAVPAPRPKKP
jgi:WD40 repeat protein